ncbi:MAG TPA: DHA2 family efflux MFS transporter permease subunit [Thermoanaerobaculia bacterium]|nr:DHA2 family efflux MFS transporter permease subunit [Thermoanaerobaculia bacterium]
MQPGRDRQLVTTAVLLGMFLAALEATAVAAAVPTAVGEMGGVSHYSWVFSVYLLTSTTTVPLFGKLSDLYGRRIIYHVSVGLFLLGSALSGMAGSFEQLILFRAIQGLGAGGVQPIAITIVGDIYSLEERGRIQALFSGVWAFASLIGPLLGGWITDTLSWRWIFYVNIPFGLASSWMLHRYLRERGQRREHRLDVLGTVTLTAAVTLLLVGLAEGPGIWGWTDLRTLGLFGGALVSLLLFLWQERRAEEPTLPLDLFQNRLIAVSSVGNTLLGMLLFSLTAFVPVFAQGVLGGTAVDAGTVLTPILVGWPISSTIAGRYLMRIGYRTFALGGSLLLIAGGALLAAVDAASGRPQVLLSMMLLGLGMGFTSMPYLLGPQNAVSWNRRGVTTSSVQFFRTIGGSIAVAALGALLNVRLHAVDPHLDPNAALDPSLRAKSSPAALAHLSSALLHGLQGVFLVTALIAAATLAVAWLFPKGVAAEHIHPERDAA